MTDRSSALLASLRFRLENLSAPALAAIGVLIIIGVGAGGLYGYRTYDFVQHDNDFCFSCHLMQEPFELFAQSAHRGLGCKACHQPNMLERSQMGLTAIVENPDSISVHADVPNDLCADCHINGDPELWTLVASSAGHRVHFESTDPELEGLQCVECHASSLHEFTAADQTCAQSGCHVDSDIQLGAMSDLTIHCAACHGFSAPLTEESGVEGALSPDRSTCLSCHEMRALVEMPDPDPHEESCASCHNPHEQETPAEAVASCATSDCHVDPMTLSPFHDGLDEEVTADCLLCHQAHDFFVDGSDCSACHQDILDDEPAARLPGVTASPSAGIATSRFLHSPAQFASTLTPRSPALHSWGYPIQASPEFLHSDHPEVDCTDCHDSSGQHGVLTVTTITDCRTCHHEGQPPAVECVSCHASESDRADPHAMTRDVSFSVGQPDRRELPFEHGPHAEEECATCHTDGVELSASAVDCTSCHEEHHDPDMDCSSCHVDAPDESHPPGEAHLTCSGSGCHQDVPFDRVPITRTACLVCHQDLADHRPEGDCAECHALATPRGSGK